MDTKIQKTTLLGVIVAVPALIAAFVTLSLVEPALGQLEDGAVTGDKIAAGAVSAEKLAAGSVGLSQLAQEVLTAIGEAAEIPDNSITPEKIADNSITTEKIQRNAVTTTKIADATIMNSDISGSAEIADEKLASSYLQIAFGLERGDKVYVGSMSFGSSYAVGGKEVNLKPVFESSIDAVIVEPSKQGYLFEVDSNGFAERTFKVKAFHFNLAAAAGPAVEVPEGTDLSVVSVSFIAVGK